MKKSEVLGSKKAQLTLFIILGLIIVSALIIFFLYVYPTFSNQSAQLSIESCVKDAISKEIPSLALNAGMINPTFSSMYLDENYTFICYTAEYYKPCVVQTPFLTTQFEKSLNTKVSQKVLDCYTKSVDRLRAEGYQVITGSLKSDISIQPTQILATISSPTSVSSGESSQTLGTNFEIKIPSDLFDVLSVSNSLLQFETNYGDTDTSTLMLYYPNIAIDKVRRDDGIKLYTVGNKKDIEFKFAVRSYAWPPGYAV
ncbi:Uncharacterised protein [uncultured archaeon]|nr:Uncharacterised protein [uncultured archaeon]